MRQIPRTMSTQHPDNAALPKWSTGEIISGEAEIYEAFFAFSELGCREVMWDWEGKDVDPHVIRKLLSEHPDFFRQSAIGKDFFITYRIPNPAVEKTEKKILIEALESIPTCYDVARTFHGEGVVPPVFEVILPFTTSYHELVNVVSYYKKVIAGRQDIVLDEPNNISVADWMGEVNPNKIEVIPLIEDMESLLSSHAIVAKYVEATGVKSLRVFLARSDPALNYGMIPAVLLAKIALSRMSKLAEEAVIDIYPIVGCGALPFRGHLSPDNMRNFIEEYAGIRTATIQSSFKYDFEEKAVKSAIETLNDTLPENESKQLEGEEEAKAEIILRKFASSYSERVAGLADFVNHVARFVPRRRARKLHVGLFGYSRELGKIHLPRTIEYTAVLYSIGIPPELLGLNVLRDLADDEMELLGRIYIHWQEDLEFAARFLCWENLNLLSGDNEILEKITNPFGLRTVIAQIADDIHALEESTKIRTGPRSLSDRLHENFANNTLIAIAQKTPDASRFIAESGRLRHGLG